MDNPPLTIVRDNVIKFPVPDAETMVEIESYFIGGLLAYPQLAWKWTKLVNSEAFTTLETKTIYDFVCCANRDGLLADGVTVCSQSPVGNFASEEEKRNWVAGWVCSVLTPMMMTSYAKTIMRSYYSRRVRDASVGWGNNEIDKAKEISQIYREMQEPDDGDGGVVSLRKALLASCETIEQHYRAGGGITGLKTGLTDLDNKLCGLDKGGLYVIAARPAMGKSALALTIAANMVRSGLSVQFFSLEMPRNQIEQRINARFSNNSIYNQKMARDIDFIGLYAVPDIIGDGFTLIDKGGVTADWIYGKSTELARRKKPDVIFIDHLAIVKSARNFNNRAQEIGEMTAMFKALAKEADCPVVLLHQLNRQTETRDDKRPTLADLRDSGTVEQDADVVMMIYREEYYLQNTGNASETTEAYLRRMQRLEAAKGIAEIIITKNRQGETGIVRTIFDPLKQVFETLAR